MDHEEFEQLIGEKIKLYHENSFEIEFLRFLLYDIMDRNYLMFERIYGYIDAINSHEVILYRITTNDGGNKVMFPDLHVITKLEKVRESLEQKLFSLLDSILPAYDRNRHFLNMIENMSVNTLIDRKRIDKFGEESRKVIQFSDGFEALFRNFQMEDYQTHLNNIQSLTIELELGDITPADAKKELNKILTTFDGIWAEMKKVLSSASKLEFTKLQEATKKFHCYAMKELKSTMKYEPRTTRGIKDLFKFVLLRKTFKL